MARRQLPEVERDQYGPDGNATRDAQRKGCQIVDAAAVKEGEPDEDRDTNRTVPIARGRFGAAEARKPRTLLGIAEKATRTLHPSDSRIPQLSTPAVATLSPYPSPRRYLGWCFIVFIAVLCSDTAAARASGSLLRSIHAASATSLR